MEERKKAEGKDMEGKRVHHRNIILVDRSDGSKNAMPI